MWDMIAQRAVVSVVCAAAIRTRAPAQTITAGLLLAFICNAHFIEDIRYKIVCTRHGHRHKWVWPTEIIAGRCRGDTSPHYGSRHGSKAGLAPICYRGASDYAEVLSFGLKTLFPRCEKSDGICIREERYTIIMRTKNQQSVLERLA